jgi:DNA repair ATPase RecN
MNPSHVTPPHSPIQQRAALSFQIGALTHSVDRMEQILNVLPTYRQSLQDEIGVLHSITDGLNALYVSLEKAQANIDSLNRRLKWARDSAEKHHNGDIAACERAEKLWKVLQRLLDSPDLNLENMDDETYKSIDAAKRLLYPN